MGSAAVPPLPLLVLCWFPVATCGTSPPARDAAAAKYRAAAQELHRSGDHQRAEDLYARALRLQPSDAPSWLNLGALRHGRGDRVGALEAFSHPSLASSAPAALNRGLCHAAEGDAAAAREAAEEALRLSGDVPYAKAHHLLANVLQDLGEGAAAARHMQAAERIAAGEAAGARHRTGGRLPGEAAVVDLRQSAAEPPREVQLVPVAESPPLWAADDVLSAADCAALRAAAAPELRRAEAVPLSDAAGSAAPPRQGRAAFLGAQRFPAAAEAARVAALLANLSIGASEDLQVASYGPGGYYATHHDATALLRRSATVLFYLSDVDAGAGGETCFPAADPLPGARAFSALTPAGCAEVGSCCDCALRVAPRLGRALLWFNMDEYGTPLPAAEHGACRLTGGEKWVANQWFAAGG